MFFVLSVPIIVPPLPAKAQTATIQHSKDPVTDEYEINPVVVKGDGKIWVSTASGWSTVKVPWTISPEGFESAITRINITVYHDNDTTEEYISEEAPATSSGEYEWNLTYSMCGHNVGDVFNLSFSMWHLNNTKYTSDNMTVYASTTVPVEDPTVIVDPLDQSDSDYYTRGTITVNWSLSPSDADWINVTVYFTNFTYDIFDELYTPSNSTSYGVFVVNTTAEDIADGAYMLIVMAWDNTTQDAPIVSVIGNTTTTLNIANGYYTLTDGVAYIAMPLTSVESEDYVEGIVNIFFKIDPPGLDPDGYGTLFPNGTFIDAPADLAVSNFTLKAPNGTAIENNLDALSVTLFSDWGLSSAWWIVSSIGYMYTFDTSEWGDGEYHAWLYVEDLNGYYLNITTSFEADNIPPVISITSPSNGSYFWLNTTEETYADITVIWSGSDNYWVSNYDIFLNELFYVSINFTSLQLNLSPDSYNVTIIAYDCAGNQDGDFVLFSVSYEQVPPQISITSHINGQRVVKALGEEVVLEWTGSDNYAIKEYVIYVDGAIATTTNETNFSLDLGPGTYNITVVARDYAGNESFDSKIIIVELPPPEPLPVTTILIIAGGVGAAAVMGVALYLLRIRK